MGGWIYYQNYSDNNKLYAIRTDGSGRKKISDDIIVDINIVGDWIFYSSKVKSPYDTCAIRIDGTGKHLV